MKKIITYAAVFIAGAICGRAIYPYGNERAVTMNFIGDTIVYRDTVRVRIPVPVKEPIPVEQIRYITVRDTIRLPAERRVYEDTLYRAVVSGIDPRLDSLSIYPSRMVVTRTSATLRHWGLGVTAGISLTPRGPQPSIGIGLTYMIR